MQELQWTLALAPELFVAGTVLVVLPLGAFLPPQRRNWTTWLALVGLALAAIASINLLLQSARPVFDNTYAVDPLAIYLKFLAIVATALVLLATPSAFRGQPHAGEVPAMVLLTCLGIMGLAASQDLALIALFIQLITVGSYVLVGMAKDSRVATEGALKLFLFSAASGAVMIYGMTLLFGLTGTLRLPELAQKLPGAPSITVLAALALVLVGYGYKITLVPFHFWAPDTYQGAPTAIAGFLAVGPKAAGLAVLLRTMVVAFPHELDGWPLQLAIVAAITMTVGNVLALRQSSLKRLLAYSSISQAGYLLVGIAAAPRSTLAVPGMLLYLAIYLFMNLGAFLAVDALERQTQSDRIAAIAGLGRRMPFAAGVLAICLLSLAGFPPFGGFIGKILLFGAVLGANWLWLAVIMAINVAISLFYYARVLEALYLRGSTGHVVQTTSPLLRVALGILAVATVATGVFPQPFVSMALHAAQALGAPPLH